MVRRASLRYSRLTYIRDWVAVLLMSVTSDGRPFVYRRRSRFVWCIFSCLGSRCVRLPEAEDFIEALRVSDPFIGHSLAVHRLAGET